MFGSFGQPQQQQQQTPGQQTGAAAGGLFGAPSAFGAPAPQPAPSAFGTLAPPQQPQAGFGFGAPQNTFGAPAQNPAGGLFGQPAINAASAFGAPQPSAFGAPAAAPSAFGAPQAGGLFGAQNPTASAFGSALGAPPQPSAFGAPQPSAFGAPAAQGGMFGAAGGGMLGAGTGPQTSPQVNQGTGNPSFQETQDKDANGTVVGRLHCISAMPAYVAWSLEELRLQDYMMNKKFAGAGGAPAVGASAFGAQPSAFGAPKPAFGAPAATASPFGATPVGGGGGGGLFGGAGGFGAQSQPLHLQSGGLFGGAGATPAFGAPAPQPAGGFGFGQQQQQQKPAFGFGAQTTAAPAFGAAGAATGGGLFGGQQTAPKPAFGFGAAPQTTAAPAGGMGLFGNTQATAAPAFGAAGAATGGGLFGGQQTAPKPAFGFGAAPQTTAAPAGGMGLFGNTQATAAPAFGAAGAATGGGLFGGQAQQQPAGGLFGATTAAPALGAFGAPAQGASGGLFGGQPAAATFGAAPGAAGGGLFGAAAATKPPGLFGFGAAATQAPATTQQGAFGFGGQPAAGGLFSGGLGGGLGGGIATPAPLFGATAAAPAQGLGLAGGFGAQPQQPQPAVQAKIDQNPFGYNPLFQSASPSAGAGAAASQAPALLATPAEKKKLAVASDLKATPRSATKIRLRGLVPAGSQTGPSLMDGQRTLTTPAKPGVKSLQLVEGSPRDPASLGLDARFTPRRNVKRLVIDDASELVPSGSANRSTSLSGFSPAPGSTARRVVNFDPTLEEAAEASLSHGAAALDDSRMTPGSSSILHGLSSSSIKTAGTPTPNGRTSPGVPRSASPNRLQGASPNGKQSEYIMSPSINELLLLSDEELRHVSNFKITRPSVGSVHFLKPVDLLHSSIGSRAGIQAIPGTIVTIEPKVCTVYPDEDDKAPVGSGLNVPAEIELHRCWSIDKATRRPIIDESDPRHDRHYKKLESMPDTHFMGFNNQTGTWCFRVDHFSRYGLVDDDDEDDATAQSGAVPVPNQPASGRRVRIREPSDEQAEPSPLGMDVTAESSMVQDSMLHVRGRVTRHMPPTRRILVDLAAQSDSDEAISDHDSQQEVYGEEDDEEGSEDDLDVEEDEEPVLYDSEAEELDSQEEYESDVVYESLEVTEDDEGDEVDEADDASLAAGRTTPPPSSLAKVAGTTSTIKRMELARSVQTMKASLFRSESASQQQPTPSGVSRSSAAAPSFSMPLAEKRASSSVFESSVMSRTAFDYQPTTPGRAGLSIDGLVPSGSPSKDAVDASRFVSDLSPQKYHRTDSPDSTQLSKTYLSELPPLDKSLAVGKERHLADAGFFMGRSFRAGWGPSGAFVVTGSATKLKTLSAISIRQIDVFGKDADTENVKHVALLETALAHSTIRLTSSSLDTGDENEMVDLRGADELDAHGRSAAGSVMDAGARSQRLYPTLGSGSTMTGYTYMQQHRQQERLVPRARLLPSFEFATGDAALAALEETDNGDAPAAGNVSQERTVWRLASALWDSLSFESLVTQQTLTVAQTEVILAALRKETIGQWLLAAIKDDVEMEAIRSPSPAARVLTLLSGRLIARALAEAIKDRNIRLATIISQINGAGTRVALVSAAGGQAVHSANGTPARGGTSQDVRANVAAQARIWHQLEAKAPGSSHVPSAHLAVWRLVSGSVDLWDETVCPAGMDWRRAFGLFFWYGQGGEWTFSQALEQYEAHFTAYLIPRPLPAYLSKAASKNGEGGRRVQDLCFHLLKVAAQPMYPLEAALEPTSFTERCLDYRLSWFMGQMLAGVKQVRGFRDTVAETAVMAGGQSSATSAAALAAIMGSMPHGQSMTSDAVTLSFAEQLQALGLWQWAVYVCLFLGTAAGREEAVRHILAQWYPLHDASGSWRHVRSTKPATRGLLLDFQGRRQTGGSDIAAKGQLSRHYVFLTETLLIAPEWIHEARALRARYAGNTLQELVSLIDAKMYGNAQRLLIAKVAAERIINGKFKMLKTILDQIPPDSVEGWAVGGGLFAAYIDILESVPELVSQVQEPLSVSVDVSDVQLEQAKHLRAAKRDHLRRDTLPRLQSILDTLAAGALDKMRALAGAHAFPMDARSDRMLAVAVGEMAARIVMLQSEVYGVVGAALPLVPNQRLAGIRVLASDWLAVSIA
ncbi:nuclear protein 96-domain-containing protein [Entophlyctis helioformis]|nr:nuclear protein 96-domain-containing protein [Entophlyctis helioformis]